MNPRPRHRRDDATPGLLVAFFASTLTMVAAVALLLHGGHDWDDVLATLLLLALAALVLLATGRRVGEQDQPSDDATRGEPRVRG